MPIVRAIFTVLVQPVDERDTHAAKEKQTLQRSYFMFLQAVIVNNVVEVILNQSKRLVFVCAVCQFLNSDVCDRTKCTACPECEI